MIYLSLAAALSAISFGQLADNVALNGATKCSNYIEVGTDLYPVGVCYSTNNDALDLSGYVVGDSTLDQNMMYVCRETTNGTIQACLQRMDATCSNVENEYADMCYDCNGADDQCECEVGGTASECALSESTVYETTLALGSGYYCNRKSARMERQVVNMCIQGVVGGQGSSNTYSYTCGGVYGRTGTKEDWSMASAQHSEADCSDVVTSAPTAMTGAPTPAPTVAGSDTVSTGLLYCSESTCDGVASPRADDVGRNGVLVAMLIGLVASIL